MTKRHLQDRFIKELTEQQRTITKSTPADVIQALRPPLTMLALSIASSFLISPLFILAVIIFVADVRGRYLDYTHVRMRLSRGDSVYSITKRYRKSWCQRVLTTYILSLEGHRDIAKTYYRDQGYKFYNLLPDDFFTNCLFNVRFWMQLVKGHLK